MILNIRHETVCSYSPPARYSVQQLRMTPRTESTQRPVMWRIRAPGRKRMVKDAHGNVSHLLTLEGLHDELRISVEGVVETVDDGGFMHAEGGSISPYTYLAETPLTRSDSAIAAFVRNHLALERHPVRALLDLSAAIRDKVLHVPGLPVGSTASQVLSAGRGAGRDHAHVFISCCRTSGIPARFVSGYVVSGDEEPAAAHAWADAWVGGFGWLSFDVTHQRLADRSYCRLALGRDNLDACPVSIVEQRTGAVDLQVGNGDTQD